MSVRVRDQGRAGRKKKKKIRSNFEELAHINFQRETRAKGVTDSLKESFCPTNPGRKEKIRSNFEALAHINFQRETRAKGVTERVLE